MLRGLVGSEECIRDSDVIYHAQVGLVEELRMNQKRFGDSEQILQSYNDGAWVNK